MALKIRLRQQGRTNRQTYRLVVTDVRCPRDGKYLEMVGWYNPFALEDNCQVHPDRIRFWLGQGAKLTPSAAVLMTKIAPQVMQEIRKKDQEHRLKNGAKRRSLRRAKNAAGESKVARVEDTKVTEKPVAARTKKPKASKE